MNNLMKITIFITFIGMTIFSQTAIKKKDADKCSLSAESKKSHAEILKVIKGYYIKKQLIIKVPFSHPKENLTPEESIKALENIDKILSDINKLGDKINEFEKNIVIDGTGKVTNTEKRAIAYTMEREYRRKLQEQYSSLAKAITLLKIEIRNEAQLITNMIDNSRYTASTSSDSTDDNAPKVKAPNIHEWFSKTVQKRPKTLLEVLVENKISTDDETIKKIRDNPDNKHLKKVDPFEPLKIGTEIYLPNKK